MNFNSLCYFSEVGIFLNIFKQFYISGYSDYSYSMLLEFSKLMYLFIGNCNFSIILYILIISHAHSFPNLLSVGTVLQILS
jgi:hypothetical protein